MNVEPPTPHDIYMFFRDLRDSLPDNNDYIDLLETLAIPHDIMPLSETLQNVLPYFRRSLNPSLLTTFQVIVRNAERNPAFEGTFSRVFDALDILEKVNGALDNNKHLFEGYLQALQLDNASASHEQVMTSLQRFLNDKCHPRTQLRVRKVFAEESAAEELGLDEYVLATASTLIDDNALYIQILQTLQLNHRQNLPWETVMTKIKKIFEDKKPAVWPGFRNFLEGVHQGNIAYPYTPQETQYYEYQEGDMAYSVFCEQYLDDQPAEEDHVAILEQKFGNFNLETEKTGVEPEPQQQPQKRDIVGPVH